MTRNEFNLLYAVKRFGVQSHRKLKEVADVSTGFISQKLREFTEEGLIDDKGITDKGLEELAPYKVDNAVIMAAGMSTRFVPISLEKPKGLLVVKNEVLIERQIEQLQEAGIRQIVIVLGYKKEAFFYLENKYEGITFIINPEYNIKNNTHTIYLAQKHIGNTYICSSDDYFEENPFEEYVYQSYYAAVHVTEKTNEWYMTSDAKGNIARVVIGGVEGDIMLGHVYWDRQFSSAIIKLINDDQPVGKYDAMLWEQVLADNLKVLPPMEVKLYPSDVIFEFDSLDELRAFDSNYVNHTHSKIIKNITRVLECRESDILNFRIIKDESPNTSFIFEYKGQKYVYRHPVEGRDEISFRQEKLIQETVKDIDKACVYLDDVSGFKLSNYLEEARELNNEKDQEMIVNVLEKIHERKPAIARTFDPWVKASEIEEKIRFTGIADKEFDELKRLVEKCFKATAGDGIKTCFCNNLTFGSNMKVLDDEVIINDWQNGAYGDPGCDVGAFIMSTMWNVEEADSFIKKYCGEEYDDAKRFHYLAYTALIAYYWYLWALYREASGTVMGENMYRRRVMAMRYARYLVKEYDL